MRGKCREKMQKQGNGAVFNLEKKVIRLATVSGAWSEGLYGCLGEWE